MVNKFFSKYLAIIKVNFRNSTLYKAEIVVMILRNIFVILLLYQLYSVTFSASKSSQFDGLNFYQILWLLIILRMFSQRWTTFEQILNEIKTGDFSYTVTRPYSYILFHFASYIGMFIARFTIDSISNFVTLFLIIGLIPFSFEGVIAGGLMLFIGISLEFLFQICAAFFAFWLEDAKALKWIFIKTTTILGGGIIPLAMFPPTLKKIAELLPFSSIYYSGARLAVKFDSILFFKSFFIQIFWLLIMILCARLLFAKGIKNVSISGG